MDRKWRETFQDPPKEYSVTPFWFWNGTLKPEELKRQMGMMKEKGIYGAFMHARAYITTPYLEKEWWEAVSACVEEGERIDFHPWLYDEYAWPSGTAGSTFEYGFQKPSRILGKGICNMAKELEVLRIPSVFRRELEQEIGERGEERLLGIYLVKGSGENLQYVRFRRLEEMPGDLLRTEERQERLLCFFVKADKNHVDYMNRETIREFLDSTHEEYARRYGEYFGERIPGIFFDEIYMSGREFAWTDSLPEVFLERHRYDLLEKLPWLLEADTRQGDQVREDYYDTAAYLYETAFFQQIGEWCERHHLMLTGHTEEGLAGHPLRQGDYFKTTRHLHIPGADCHDYRYRLPRKISFHEPKYSVSVARAYGRKRAMSEAMGGAGWGCSLQEYRRGIHTMGAMGINFFVLHGMYYECDHQGSQADWPASFFYQNPYWKYFKYFADEIRRICYMNSVGEPVVQIGIFYPIQDMYRHTVCGRPDEAGRRIEAGYHQCLYTLVENQMDADVLDEDTILASPVREGYLESGGRRIRVLLFPAEGKLTERMQAYLARFQAAGGNVLFYGEEMPPRRMPEFIAGLIGRDVEILEGDSSEIYVNHRKTEGCDSYFVSNSEDVGKRLKLRLAATGKVSRMNPVTGKEDPMGVEYTEKGVTVEVELGPDEACYVLVESAGKNGSCEEEPAGKDGTSEEETARKNGTCEAEVFRKEAGRRLPRIKRLGYETVTGKWEFLPLPAEHGKKYEDMGTETRLEIPYALFGSDLDREAERIRICNTPWQQGRCGRHLSLWKGNWITRRPHWQDSMDRADLYFRREFILEEEVRRARICIAAVQQFSLYINGRLAGEGNGTEPVTVEADGFFRTGENLIAVHVHNPRPYGDSNICSVEELPADRMISLLLEGKLYLQEAELSLQSDAQWIVNNVYEEGWEDPAFHPAARHHDPAHRLWGERDGVWLYAWERGKPPLLPWGDLPLFGERLQWPRRVIYQITLPTGTAEITAPEVKGEYSCRIDGSEVSFEGVTSLSVKPLDRVRIMELEVTAGSPDCGLLRPVEILLRPVSVPYGEWAALGLSWFSGRALYRNRFDWRPEVSSGEKEVRYILRWGQRDSCAEVWVNGKKAGECPWAPYEVDITEFLLEGENEIGIVTANSAAPSRRHMLVDEGMALGWNRYWNEDNIDRESEDLVSGLLGPVRIYRQCAEKTS